MKNNYFIKIYHNMFSANSQPLSAFFIRLWRMAETPPLENVSPERLELSTNPADGGTAPRPLTPERSNGERGTVE